jgi:hypothetical protein
MAHIYKRSFVNFIDEILNALLKKSNVSGVFCDLAITFHHVNHDMLLLILLPLVSQPFVGFSFLNQVILGQDILPSKKQFY